MKNIEKLEELTSELPESLTFHKAKCHFELGSYGETIELIELFLSRVGREDKSYEEALALYSKAEERERLKKAEERERIAREQIAKLQLVSVPGGCFQMGDIFGKGDDDEKPVHEVCVDGYQIGKYEVTQGQWEAIMGSNPSRFKDGEDYPVERVSWNEVQEFIGKLNAQTGKQYRLPTEAEWEYACRSGGKKELYCGGDNISSLAWYNGNSGGKTHKKGTKTPNGLGIYDMSGNVWEWVEDRYGREYYSASPRNNPKGPSSGLNRVERGGSWNNSSGYVRAANRSGFEPDYRSVNLGFRLVLPPGQ